MNLDEIKEQSWIIEENLEIDSLDLASISILEQETGFDRLRAGIKDESNPEIKVCCTDQTMITELSKSEFFHLERVTISNHERTKNFVLEVHGVLEPNGLTIRKKKHNFSEEEKKVRSERARHNFSKHRTQITKDI